MLSFGKTKSFPEHLGITRVGSDFAEVGSKEIEKCSEEGEFETFGGWFLALAVLDQKGQDVF